MPTLCRPYSASFLLTAAVASFFALPSRPCFAFPAEDLVTSLPGLDNAPPTKWYSGYLRYRLPCLDNRLINTHYVYIEKANDDDDHHIHGGDPDASTTSTTASKLRRTAETTKVDESPLIFWSNGGPGASSLFGLLTELGPFLLNDDSLQTEEYEQTGVPTLLENKSSWNKLGSLLIFDAPAPVGFSYCDDNPEGDGLSCGGWDDEDSAWNNYHALMAFFGKFPELKTKQLFLTGESYAGVYVPSLARKILQHNKGEIPGAAKAGGQNNSFHIPIKGFAVGDACVGTHINCGVQAPIFQLMFFGGHGQISLKTMGAVRKTCTDEELHTPGGTLSEECDKILKKALDSAGGFYEYSLYDDCTYRNGLMSRKRPYRSTARHVDIEARGALNDYTCGGGDVMEEYVRHPLVREALHVNPASNFFDGDNLVGFNYTLSETNLMPFYREVVVGKYASEGVRVLVYNGDTDPSINSFVAQNWTMQLGLREEEEWKPWTIDACRRMGGFVNRYEGSFDFLTVRGAGHMVPTYKPEAAFAFLKSWIGGVAYPEYDPNCEKPLKI